MVNKDLMWNFTSKYFGDLLGVIEKKTLRFLCVEIIEVMSEITRLSNTRNFIEKIKAVKYLSLYDS